MYSRTVLTVHNFLLVHDNLRVPIGWRDHPTPHPFRKEVIREHHSRPPDCILTMSLGRAISIKLDSYVCLPHRDLLVCQACVLRHVMTPSSSLILYLLDSKQKHIFRTKTRLLSNTNTHMRHLLSTPSSAQTHPDARTPSPPLPRLLQPSTATPAARPPRTRPRPTTPLRSRLELPGQGTAS